MIYQQKQLLQILNIMKFYASFFQFIQQYKHIGTVSLNIFICVFFIIKKIPSIYFEFLIYYFYQSMLTLDLVLKLKYSFIYYTLKSLIHKLFFFCLVVFFFSPPLVIYIPIIYIQRDIGIYIYIPKINCLLCIYSRQCVYFVSLSTCTNFCYQQQLSLLLVVVYIFHNTFVSFEHTKRFVRFFLLQLLEILFYIIFYGQQIGIWYKN
eukprot:TRINITY_DN9846_c0_g2_i8.p2 TRINITY_DN9846_c0_g2~~TRINITY_DN9846_c0_g2_i8.p2  ORF type:complete len:207 (+),score=-18.53 TRINITY_DN9846_c0_g2_i8:182-802(+)